MELDSDKDGVPAGTGTSTLHMLPTFKPIPLNFKILEPASVKKGSISLPLRAISGTKDSTLQQQNSWEAPLQGKWFGVQQNGAM